MSAGTRLARVVPCVDGSGLAVIVALVDVDDAAMVERGARVWYERGRVRLLADGIIPAEPWENLSAEGRRAWCDDFRVPLAAALTPPERTGTEGA